MAVERGAAGSAAWHSQVTHYTGLPAPPIEGHGTSTKVNDATETKAIRRVFGTRDVPVSSTKSMIGHTLGAAGAIEAAATVLSVYHQVAHPTINYHTEDPECDLDVIPNEAREMKIDAAMSNAFGFGGQNAVLVFSRD